MTPPRFSFGICAKYWENVPLKPYLKISGISKITSFTEYTEKKNGQNKFKHAPNNAKAKAAILK